MSGSNVRRPRTALPLAGLTVLLVGTVVALQAAGPTTPKPTANSAPSHSAADEDLTKESIVEGSSAETTLNQGVTSSTSQSTDLEVNGQNISVPANGEIHQVTNDENGHTSIDVVNETNGSSTSTNIEVRSVSGARN